MVENTGIQGVITKVSGPLVVASGLQGAQISDLCRVGEIGLLGEVIEIRGDHYSIQVYEETGGIGPGQPVISTGMPLSVELAPGMISSVYDGVQRPLDVLGQKYGTYIVRGAEAPAINREKKWDFVPTKKAGDKVVVGDIIGTVKESSLIEHRIMIPADIKGEVVIKSIEPKNANVTETIAVIQLENGKERELSMLQKWPVRKPRPYKKKVRSDIPFSSGQRVLDMFFPLVLGGTGCVPGPFGSGKTVVQHQLSKWANTEVIVFIGCGERGNEMTDVLLEFPHLVDPKSGKPLMDRTILVANTSNMPVAAREASVFTGITIAEYYRDMGYNVALMGDSTSRWAEAMREMSGRLEEMPGEEGYPAYLVSRLAGFYERGGSVLALGSDPEPRKGSLTVMGAVSPPGGDLAEPVVQGTLRVTKVFWALDAQLAYQRHFPAINWLNSYSLYNQVVDEYFNKHINPKWGENRVQAMAILKVESELEELVRLVGMDALSPDDRLLMEVARMIREDFLHQLAFDEIDTYTSPEKQFKMLETILLFNQKAVEAIKKGASIAEIEKLPVLEEIGRMKMTLEKELQKIDQINKNIVSQLSSLVKSDSTMQTTADR